MGVQLNGNDQQSVLSILNTTIGHHSHIFFSDIFSITQTDTSPSTQATDFNRRFHISVDESENRSQVKKKIEVLMNG